MSNKPFRPSDVASVIGMAALWLSAFKQLLYPMLFTYYRTGSENAVVAQGVYAAALVAVAFALLVAHGRLGGLLGKGRWAVAVLGVGGALGIALRTPIGPFPEGDLATMCAGAVLSAAYLPVHLAFWILHASRLERVGASRAVAASFALFLVMFGALSLAGANNMYVSVACPIVSAAMALACPRPDAAPAEGGEGAGGAEIAVEAGIEAANGAGAGTVPEPATAHVPPEPEPASPASPALPAGFAAAFDLSGREAELAAYAHRNWSARRIAGELFIAESTVYTHLKRIYRKTDVHSKHELIELIDSWHHPS